MSATVKAAATSLPGEALPLSLRKFTVEEYHRLIAAGVIQGGEPFELLEGLIVSKMTKNPPHVVALQQLAELFTPLLPTGWHRRLQDPITTTASEPEPDLALVRGTHRDYGQRHPGPAEVGLVVEVADSSLHEDRQVKGRIYASESIGCYWLVNLVDRWVEVYTQPSGPQRNPRYRRRRDFTSEQSIPLLLDGVTVGKVPVRAILS